MLDYNRELLCKDCQHSYRSWPDRLFGVKIYQCRLPGNTQPDEYSPVTGKITKGKYISCGFSRMKSGVCGPQAIHWVPRNTRRDLFLLLKKDV